MVFKKLKSNFQNDSKCIYQVPSLPIALSGRDTHTQGRHGEGLLWGCPSRHQLHLSCPRQSLGMVEFAGAGRLGLP